jgi:hypothetical protein
MSSGTSLVVLPLIVAGDSPGERWQGPPTYVRSLAAPGGGRSGRCAMSLEAAGRLHDQDVAAMIELLEAPSQ